MNNNKERERAELHKTIWNAATKFVHGGIVSSWEFKDYFLGIMFYRFISENITEYINLNERRAGNINFDYVTISDKDAEFARTNLLIDKGFFILPSELFCNVRNKAKNDENLNVTLNNIFLNIESSARGTASENNIKGLFSNINVDSPNLGSTVLERNKVLTKLLDVIGELNLGTYSDNTIDVFGDAYEYLMGMYASTAGKKGGEFFTPQEVGELLAKITLIDKTEVNKVYDPACGSGGLLLKFAKILGKENVKQGFFGQEINLTTYNLARINMFLHDINYNKFNIARGDTLINPIHWDDQPFDAIVSNPPYAIPWEGKSNPLLINDPRYSPAGILAPESKADLAFTMHILSWLSQKGVAAIVEFPGVLYRRNEKGEPAIRKYLVNNNFVDTIIQLPADLFFGTPIATCIIVLKKSKKDNNILFVEASEEFIRGKNKSKLSNVNIENILNLVKERISSDKKAVLVSNEEIENNDYNLSVNTYLKNEKETIYMDIKEHNNKIKEIVERQSIIRQELDEIIAEIEGGNNE